MAAGAKMRTAIIHDWLITPGGAEAVLIELLRLYPSADLFTLMDFFPAEQRTRLGGARITTSFLQGAPWARTRYRRYLPLMPLAVEQFDLSGYDMVISSSHAVAHGVLTHPGQIHVVYLNRTMRYAWDQYHSDLRAYRLDRGLRTVPARLAYHFLRQWDWIAYQRAGTLIANSRYCAARIQQLYQRQAEVLYPPVPVDALPLVRDKDEFFVTAGRIVGWKNLDLIIDAFNRLKLPLKILGEGPAKAALERRAASNIKFLGWQPRREVAKFMGAARAFVFASGVEEFGLAPVEAQACGTPVIAYASGGVTESVYGLDQPRPTGVFFAELTAEALCDAVAAFEANRRRLEPQACRENALRFAPERFADAFQGIVRRASAPRPDAASAAGS